MTAKMQIQDGNVKWKNAKCPLSYKELLGIDGEAIEFEWNILPGFSSLQILQKIQDVLRERNIKTEEFTDWIIFMSMFNDIDWTREGNDGICISNSEKSRNTRRDSLMDTGRFWVLEMKRSGLELFVTHLKENGTLQPLRWWNDSKDTGHPVFKSISALSRGILKKKNRDTIPFNADASNTEL